MENKTGLTSFSYTKDGFIDYGEHLADNGLKPFEFEKVDFLPIGRWAYQHREIGFVAGFVYIAVVFGLQRWMKNREAYSLKRELFLWNMAVGIFSICGFVRIAPEFLYKLNRPNGFYRSLCVMDGYSPQFLFWAVLFVLSKFIELVDTIFIVLRKKPVVVLQWYHHFITVGMAWLLLAYNEPVNMYLAFFNYGVHSMMYPYFAFKALEFKIPRVIAKVITTCQFSQMVVNLFLISYTGFMYYSGQPCYRHPFTLNSSIGVTISFNILFGRLWYQSVVKAGKKKAE